MDTSAQPPLTHHEILRLVAPFTRRERLVDLAATDRARRVLAFREVMHDGDDLLREQLRLDLSDPAQCVLVRETHAPDGLIATASASGDEPEAVLERVLSLPPHGQFRRVGGTRVADSFRDDDERARWQLVSCAARVGDLGITLDARTVIGEPMAVKLAPRTPALRFAPPDDVLALVGRRWRVLREVEGVWTSTLTAPVREPARSQVACAQFAEAVAHLAAVFGASPGAYHSTWRRTRWQVYLRRFTPLLVCVGLVAVLPLIDRFLLAGDTALHPGFLMLTPLMFAVLLLATWREMPTIEVPPRPLPLAADAWSPGLAGALSEDDATPHDRTNAASIHPP